MVIKKENNGVFGQGKIEPWTHEEMMRYGKIAGILVIAAVILFAGWIFYISPALTKTTDPPKDPKPDAEKIIAPVIAGTILTNSAAANTGSWYSIGTKEYRKGEKFQYNGINFIIAVSPDGRGTYLYISSEELQKLIDPEKSLRIKIKFRIKGTNEIFEAPVVSFSSIMIDTMKGWTETLGNRSKNLQPSDVEWQPEFD